MRAEHPIVIGADGFGDVEIDITSREIRGTPPLFIDGVVYLSGYDAATLAEAMAT